MTRAGRRGLLRGAMVWLFALLACARSFPESANLFAETPHDPWGEPLALEWQATLTEATPWEYKPIERGGAALNDSRDRVYVGTRVGTLWCLRVLDGREVWHRDLGAPIGSTPLYHEGTLYVGTDGGELIALNPETGQVLWRFATKGLVSAVPAITEDALFFADSRNTVWSLHPFKGTYGWHYNRDVPEGFTVTGHAAPRVFGELLVAGFSDGKLVGMSASDGSIIWEVDLGGTAKFRDVDATPVMAGGRIITASYAKGVFAVDPHEGAIEWHHAVEGATQAAVKAGRAVVGEAKGGVRAVAVDDGRLLWRTRLVSGAPGTPVFVGRLVAVATSRTGWTDTRGSIVLLNPRTGTILQDLSVGLGFSAPLTASGRDLYAVSNGGTIYKFRLNE